VAQSWDATWHPVVGYRGCAKFIWVHRGRTRDLPSGLWIGRIELAARPTGSSFNYTTSNVFEFSQSIMRRGKGSGLSPALGTVQHTTIAY
jgi:hypothetical protein